MPWSTLYNCVPKLYAGLVKIYGFDSDLIPHKIYSNLAKEYGVSPQPAEIRLKEVNLLNPIKDALEHNLKYLQI